MRHIYSEWDTEKYLIIIVKEIQQRIENDVDTKFIFAAYTIDKEKK